MMMIQNRTPISKIREEQKMSADNKLAQLEIKLAEETKDRLAIMEATAQVYEELLALQRQMGGNF